MENGIINLKTSKFAVHDDVIKWKYFPRYWPFVPGIHRSPVNIPPKSQWHGALIFFICALTNSWANNRDAGDLRRHRAHYGVIVMRCYWQIAILWNRHHRHILLTGIRWNRTGIIARMDDCTTIRGWDDYLPLVCFRGYGILSARSVAILRAAEGQVWCCDAKCG